MMRARKRFGQNFLNDKQLVNRIIHSIAPGETDFIIEIGPGRGALTEALAMHAGRLEIIEIDKELIQFLSNILPDKTRIHEADVLKFDFESILPSINCPYNVKIVGNLPYNISTPLLFRLFKFTPRIHQMFFMLQLEVVERICAKPSTKNYGRLSVMSQYHCTPQKLFNVPAESFTPKPKVTSAFIQLTPHNELDPLNDSFQQKTVILERILISAFSKRRKTLRNALSDFLKEEDFDRLNLDPKLRPENLSVDDYLSCVDYLLDHSEDNEKGPA